MAEQERCETCRFWDGEPADGVDVIVGCACGSCRRFPPAPEAAYAVINERGSRTVHMGDDWLKWPNSLDTDWCGEYQPREEQ